MANDLGSFILILDTRAPSGLRISLNDNAQSTTSRDVTLKTTLSDADTTNYQMKVWGIDGVASEAAASWENFAAEKNITLTAGDGLKTVYVKVRDDVWNESAPVTDSITLGTIVPADSSIELVGVNVQCYTDGKTRYIREYQGFDADFDKLPITEDMAAGSRCLFLDTGKWARYHLGTMTWYRIP